MSPDLLLTATCAMDGWMDTFNILVPANQSSKLPIKAVYRGFTVGSLFWNLLMKPYLQNIDKEWVHVQAFADDLLLLVTASTSSPVRMPYFELQIRHPEYKPHAHACDIWYCIGKTFYPQEFVSPSALDRAEGDTILYMLLVLYMLYARKANATKNELFQSI